MKRRGMLLAGGTGTRLHPVTRAVSKQLLPVYDKPMVYYPLTTLMLSGVRDILVISTPGDQPLFQRLLGDGRQWGISLSYASQPEPRGIAQAYVIGRDFVAGGPSCLVLGDNLFFAQSLSRSLMAASARTAGATIFAHRVVHPEAYGVVEIADDGRALGIEEKPITPRSAFAVTGLYFYDERAAGIAASLKPSKRGELEITDLNAAYLRDGSLFVELLGRGAAWFDTGTHASLLHAAQFVETLQERQGLIIGAPEEVAFRMSWIDAGQLRELADPHGTSAYGRALRQLADEGR